MNPLRDCPVLFQQYEERGNMQPCVLPNCGHTISRRAVEGLLQTSRRNGLFSSCIQCPTCKTVQTKVANVYDCPPNWALMDSVPSPDTDSNEAAAGPSTSAGTADTPTRQIHTYKRELDETVQLMEAAWQRAEEAELRAEAAEAAAAAAARGEPVPPRPDPASNSGEQRNRSQQRAAPAPQRPGNDFATDPSVPGLDEIFQALPPEMRMLRMLFEHMHHM